MISSKAWDEFSLQLLGACFIAALFRARTVRKFEHWALVWALHHELGYPPLPMTAPWVTAA